MWTESAKMVTAVHGGQDHKLKSPFLTKKDDPVTNQLLFGTMPLKPTYIQHQMADQTFQKVEDKYDPPIILRRPFLSTVEAIIYIGTREVHMQFPSEKVRTRRRRRNHSQRRQIIKDGWVDYDGQVVRSKDI